MFVFYFSTLFILKDISTSVKNIYRDLIIMLKSKNRNRKTEFRKREIDIVDRIGQGTLLSGR